MRKERERGRESERDQSPQVFPKIAKVLNQLKWKCSKELNTKAGGYICMCGKAIS